MGDRLGIRSVVGFYYFLPHPVNEDCHDKTGKKNNEVEYRHGKGCGNFSDTFYSNFKLRITIEKL